MLPEAQWEQGMPALYKGGEQQRQTTPREKVAWLNMLANHVKTGVEYTMDKHDRSHCFVMAGEKRGAELGTPVQYTGGL